MVEVIRQGDVAIIRTDRQLPSGCGAVKLENGRVILAHGEVTGHAHALEPDGVALLESPEGRRFLKVDKEAAVTHEEHATVTIPEGIWEVRRQREYSPQEIRVVAD